MRRKFVCGIVLCLAFALAGCGNSKEKQAVNYYQNELGLDREDAEELANELYGDDDEDDYVTGAEPEEVVVEPLLELLNSEWYELKVQIYDMIFSNDWYMTEEDIRKAVEGSAYEVEITEGFDSDGNVCITDLMIDGETVAEVRKSTPGDSNNDLVAFGLLDDREYYIVDFAYKFYLKDGYLRVPYYENGYDKKSTEFEDLETRDDVLAYLAESGFIEVEEEQAPYPLSDAMNYSGYSRIWPETTQETALEFIDTPHYYSKGAQSITFYRILKLGETDQEVESYYTGKRSGAHLNLVNCVTFEFNTDGTIASMSWGIERYMVVGEKI